MTQDQSVSMEPCLPSVVRPGRVSWAPGARCLNQERRTGGSTQCWGPCWLLPPLPLGRPAAGPWPPRRPPAGPSACVLVSGKGVQEIPGSLSAVGALRGTHTPPSLAGRHLGVGCTPDRLKPYSAGGEALPYRLRNKSDETRSKDCKTLRPSRNSLCAVVSVSKVRLFDYLNCTPSLQHVNIDYYRKIKKGT